MEFSYIGEKPLVILYGDFQRMRDYCDDLMRFGIEPQMIIADEEATADEKSWWGIPVNTVEALTQYKNEQFLSIVPIGRWLEGTKNKIREIDEQLSHYVIRDIELLMRLCMKSVIKDMLPGANTAMTRNQNRWRPRTKARTSFLVIHRISSRSSSTPKPEQSMTIKARIILWLLRR